MSKNELRYERLSAEIEQKMNEDIGNNTLPTLSFDEDKVIRRNNERDKASILRTAFIRDIDKIMHCPYYNRYADKTQVFSFYKNDDITRRGLHVQLVSRICWKSEYPSEIICLSLFSVAICTQPLYWVDGGYNIS